MPWYHCTRAQRLHYKSRPIFQPVAIHRAVIATADTNGFAHNRAHDLMENVPGRHTLRMDPTSMIGEESSNLFIYLFAIEFFLHPSSFLLPHYTEHILLSTYYHISSQYTNSDLPCLLRLAVCAQPGFLCEMGIIEAIFLLYRG